MVLIHEAGAYVHDKLLLPDCCNPFAMSSLGVHLCSPSLACSMNKSDGAKESCDISLLMSLCGDVALQQLFPCVP